MILRHGESTWNQKNLFTGWHDVQLTDKGRGEAVAAGRTMLEAGLYFDTSHTSLLERHYGALQGLDKKETTERHGEEQTYIWRRSFDVPPPPVDTSSPEHPVNDRRYRLLDRSLLPGAECLKDVVARVLPYWNDSIVPQLRNNQTVLVTAHGNSLRALVMHLEQISEADIAELNIPTGAPKRYTFNDDMSVASAQYLGDVAAIEAAAAAVAKQAST